MSKNTMDIAELAELELYMKGPTTEPRPTAVPTTPPAATSISDPQVAYVVREIRDVLNGEVSKLKIMIAVHQGVLIMRKFTKLGGAKKKSILLQAMNLIIDQSNMSEDDRLASKMLVELGASDVIDSLVFMASGIKMKLGGGLRGCLCAPTNDAPQ